MKTKQFILILLIVILMATYLYADTTTLTIEAEDMNQDNCNYCIDIDGGVMIRGDESIYTTINIESGGDVTFTITAKGVEAGGEWPILQLSIDDIIIGTNTIDGSDYEPYVLTGTIESGSHKLSLAFINDYYDDETKEDRNVGVDKIVIQIESKDSVDPDPESVTIQAEDYDEGGEGVAYHDTTAENTGNCGYREYEGVDIFTNTDDGCHIGATQPEEWTTYTYNFPSDGIYNIILYVARITAGTNAVGTLYVDDISYSFSVPTTETWYSFTPVVVSIDVTEGSHVLKIEQGNIIFTFDKLMIVKPVDPLDTAKVRVSWDAFVPEENYSTPEGYRIFVRGKDTSYNYTSPIATDKFPNGNITEGNSGDITVYAPRGKETVRYVIVRSFLDNLESPNSDEVSITIDRTSDINLNAPTGVTLTEIN